VLRAQIAVAFYYPAARDPCLEQFGGMKQDGPQPRAQAAHRIGLKIERGIAKLEFALVDLAGQAIQVLPPVDLRRRQVAVKGAKRQKAAAWSCLPA
jgi:hypothetical protein